MKNNIYILKSLINFSKPIDVLEKEISSLKWDNEIELVEIKKSHLDNVENKLKAGELKESEVETWANLIECREDIKFENELVKEKIEKFANPTLFS